MERIITEVGSAYPTIGVRLHPRLITTRQRGHWRVDLSWTLTHTAFVDPQSGSSPERIRAFLERVIARELELTSQEGRTELRRFRGEQIGLPAEPQQASPSAVSLWERLDDAFDDEVS